MIFAGDGETCLSHLGPEPGGVVANAVDKRRVRHQHLKDLRNEEKKISWISLTHFAF